MSFQLINNSLFHVLPNFKYFKNKLYVSDKHFFSISRNSKLSLEID